MIERTILDAMKRHVEAEKDIVGVEVIEFVGIGNDEIIHCVIVFRKILVALRFLKKILRSFSIEVTNVANVFTVVVLVSKERIHKSSASLATQNGLSSLVRIRDLSVIFLQFSKWRKNDRKFYFRFS